MKNMKKTILGVAILAIALIMMMGSVNAASLTAGSEKISKGETVSIVVNMEPSMATEINLTYPAEFEYVGATTSIGSAPMVTDKGGSLIATYLTSDGETTINQITFTFKANENTEAGNFAVTGFTTDVAEDTMTSATTTVVVADEEITEPTPEEPTTSEEPTTDSNNENSGSETTTTTTEGTDSTIVGTDGKVITKLPQTGTPVFVGAIALIVVAGAVLVIRKVK